MPTYEYECQKCGFTFELMQGINDKPRSRCPLCRGKVQRLIGAGVGIVFKGSGFYVTDSRSGKSGSGHSGTSAKEASTSEKSTAETSSPDKKSSSTGADAGAKGSKPSRDHKTDKKSH